MHPSTISGSPRVAVPKRSRTSGESKTTHLKKENFEKRNQYAIAPSRNTEEKTACLHYPTKFTTSLFKLIHVRDAAPREGRASPQSCAAPGLSHTSFGKACLRPGYSY